MLMRRVRNAPGAEKGMVREVRGRMVASASQWLSGSLASMRDIPRAKRVMHRIRMVLSEHLRPGVLTSMTVQGEMINDI